MVFTIHAGHAAAGQKYCGAVGLLDESKEARLIKNSVIKYLNMLGVEAVDCTVDSGSSQTNVLEQICDKCNAANADLNISIHLNSSRADFTGDNKQGGFEMYATSYTNVKLDVANRITNNIKALGFGTHSAPLKTSGNLYFLKHTKKPSLLLEICFVDDEDDFDKYVSVGYDAIGKAIAEAIANKSVSTQPTQPSQPVQNKYSIGQYVKYGCSYPAPTLPCGPQYATGGNGKAEIVAIVSGQAKYKMSTGVYCNDGDIIGVTTKSTFNLALQHLQGAICDDGIANISKDGIYGSQTDNTLSKINLTTSLNKVNGKWININVTAWVQCRVGCGAIDGKYGNDTTRCVKAYQQKKGLKVDGIAGKNTIKAILRDCGVDC